MSSRVVAALVLLGLLCHICDGCDLSPAEINATHCNSRAATVAIDCTCSACIYGFAGMSCDRCSSGFTGWPHCFDECTSTTVSCSGNAVEVSGIPPACVCTCKTGWTGDRCDRCALGYGGPECGVDDCTSITNSCSGHATGVSPGDDSDSCNCDCFVGFGGQRCNRCDAGFAGYPDCVESCSNVSVSCSGRAASVSPSADTTCDCDCFAGFAGDRCEVCAAGYAGWPDCIDACTDPAVSCEAAGTASVSGASGNCTCICNLNVAGARCEKCSAGFFTWPVCDPDDCTTPAGSCNNHGVVDGSEAPCCDCDPGYAGEKCEQCAEGYSGWPGCEDDCTLPSVSCNGHASSVSGPNGQGECVCQCVRGYAGTRCEVCAHGFDGYPTCLDACVDVEVSCVNPATAVAGPPGDCVCTCMSPFSGSRCQLCAPGFRAPPTCYEDCTSVTVSCSGNAQAVSGTWPSCECSCVGAWQGARCEYCPDGYESENCTLCIDGFDISTVTGMCTETCTSNASCNNRGIVSSGGDFCHCACFDGWSGDRCEHCAVGYAGWPDCEPEFCDDAILSCNGHASGISGIPPHCICTCASGYSGERCQQCDVGFTDYPSCAPTCHSVTACNGHAAHVSGTHPDCTCSCSRGYSGSSCNQCASGFSGYPECVDQCVDIVTSCSGHADSVTGTPGSCICACWPGFAAESCDRCAAGFAGYPQCTVDDCTSVVGSCNGRAHGVTGTAPSCICDCWSNWAGSRCTECSPGFEGPNCDDACLDHVLSCGGRGTGIEQRSPACICKCKRQFRGSLCDQCASGFSGYPECVDQCVDIVTSCSGHADSVTGPPGSCICACWPGFAGESCDRCAAGFAGYPQCTVDDCTSVVGSCNGRAHGVTGTAPSCICDCWSNWAGSRCTECSLGFEGPNCDDACSNVTVSCNGHATSVVKVDGSCVCSCFRRFTGARCNECSAGFGSYPTCSDTCTDPLASCNNNGVAVNGTPPDCSCVCEKGFAGTRCDHCDTGFELYPFCFDDCSDVFRTCGPNADAVAAGVPCSCICKPGWAGELCDRCAPGFDGAECSMCATRFQGPSCGECKPAFEGPECSFCKTGLVGPECESCAVGFTGDPPHCIEACDIMNSCNSNAWEVSTTPPCACRCKLGWSGERCERCTLGFSSPTCTSCADGFLDFPLCTDTCTNPVEGCYSHGYSISGSPPNCTCECHNGYAGERCERCAAGFGGWPMCVDQCTNVSVSCVGPASSVTGVPGSCSCTCSHGFAGHTCGHCAAGFTGFPFCRDACSDPAVSCNARGVAVTRHPEDPLRCICTCSQGFGGDTCNRCSPGYGGYPACVVDECTHNTVSCNGNSARGSHEIGGTYPDCACQPCQARFNGSRCERCASGYLEFPQCFDSCENNTRSCNGRATKMTLIGQECHCTCDVRFAGSRCEICSAGFEPPNCVVPTCESITANCNGHATSVTRNPDGSCLCTCKPNYVGPTCGQCRQGYTSYPGCVDACTLPAVSCFAQGAVAVTGLSPTCFCSCAEGYAGRLCDSCAQNFGGFPNCLPIQCQSVTISCNGLAAAVFGHPPNCECLCFHGYTGRNCQSCAAGFAGWPNCQPDCTTVEASCVAANAVDVRILDDGSCRCICKPRFAGPRCEFCAVGYTNYPKCEDDCTSVAASCNGLASSVGGTPPHCICTCHSNRYAGDRCERCSPGNVGWPFCEPNLCVSPASCNWRGAPAEGSSASNCSCVCDDLPGSTAAVAGRRRFTGARCSECATGYTDWPTCTPDCTTNEGSCNGNAVSFAGTVGSCTCVCAQGFAGATCSECAPGFRGYPDCTPDCTTVEGSCNGHALAVDGLLPDCICYCTSRFTGVACEQCAAGRGGYPVCDMDDCTSNFGSCNGHAESFNGTEGNCSCVCKRGYTGPSCGQCAPGFGLVANGSLVCIDLCISIAVSCNNNSFAVAPSSTPGQCLCACFPGFAGEHCERCVAGFSGWPSCVDSCTIKEVSCDPSALGVTGVAGNCHCSCPRGVGGARCHRCAAGFGLPSPYVHPNCKDMCSNVNVSCGGRAVAVSGAYPTCFCTCKRGFAGRLCDRCDTGFTSFPTCFDLCSVSTTCAGNAVAVGGSVGNCTCECLPNWAPPNCENCADGYVGPECTDACTSTDVSCGPNAINVTMSAGGVCICGCARGWRGERCERCAIGFVGENCTICVPGHGGSDCSECLTGFGGWPCMELCNNIAVSCNGNAVAVTTGSTAGTCICDCAQEYAGARCEMCAPGYAGYPLCGDACTSVDVSCGGRASSVEPDELLGGCTCHCLPAFRGGLCDQCAVGYALYPSCVPDCTNLTISCGAHGTALLGGTPGNCLCECRVGIAGARCDQCAAGYDGFPECVESCDNINVSCSGHAYAVGGSSGQCVCVCKPEYAGLRCDRCAAGYSHFPNCTEDCTNVNVSCSGRAASVRPADGEHSNSSCVCQCEPQFAGLRCEHCALRVHMWPSCSACTAGYSQWPHCVDNCSDAAISCSGRGTVDTLASIPGNCTCICERNYGGQRCEHCANGFGAYPLCYDTCTVDSASCHGQGTINEGSTAANCTCTCASRYGGTRCDECAPGYTLHPSCVPDCSVLSLSCDTNTTLSVHGPPGDCTCECKPGFGGPRCGECASGFSGFPSCEDSCTVPAVSCAGSALRVKRGESGSCECDCEFNFDGRLCERCASGFDAFPSCSDACINVNISCNGFASSVRPTAAGADKGCDCDCLRGFDGERCTQCTAGYAGWPRCEEDCTETHVSCNGHADVVNGTAPSCECHCKIGFAGTRCDRCDEGYAQYPMCYENCTHVEVSCNGHAWNVSGLAPRCSCSCKPGFDGSRCEECARGFGPWPSCIDQCSDKSASCASGGEFAESVAGSPGHCVCRCKPRYTGIKCDQCDTGFSSFPYCIESCDSVVASCNARASSVTSIGGRCVCQCLPGYTGSRCEACAPGYAGWPDCADNCTVLPISCEIHAVDVLRNDDGTCSCRCTRGYSGRRCDSCAVGFTGYPNCIDACTHVDISCGGRGTSVSGQPGACTCVCLANFTGRECHACAVGYSNFPLCHDDCTRVDASCGGRAVFVAGLSPECICDCHQRFAPPRCDKCADGYRMFPECIDNCSNPHVSCGGRAIAVSRVPGTAANCTCECEHPFTGDRCSECRRGFTSWPSCHDACLHVDVSCGDHASHVAPTERPGQCACECKPGFGGARCEECARGFSGFPNCIDDCSEGEVSCGGRGAPFEGDDGVCHCTCSDPLHDSGTRCSTCIAGYTSFPVCVDACVDVNISCGGRATAVSGSPSSSGCICECLPHYDGSLCDRCGVSRADDFPVCSQPTPSPFLGAPPLVVMDPSTGHVSVRALRGQDVVAARFAVFAGYFVSHAETQLRTFEGCVVIAPAEASSNGPTSIGFWAHPPTIRFESNATHLMMWFMQARNFEVATPQRLHLSFTGACFTNGVPPVREDPFTITIKPHVEALGLNVAAGGFMSAAAPIAAVGSPAALADLQAMALLGTLPCAGAAMRRAESSGVYLLSPLGVFIGGDTALFLGAFAPAVCCALLHLIAAGGMTLVRRHRAGTAPSDATSTTFVGAAALLRFPAISILIAGLLYQGTLAFAILLIRRNLHNGGLVTLGLCGVVSCLTFVASVTLWGCSSGTRKMTLVANATRGRAGALGRFVRPIGTWSPTPYSSMFGLAVGDVKHPRFAGLSLWIGTGTAVIVASAPVALADCVIVYWCIGGYSLVVAAVIAVIRPYRSGLANTTSVLMQVSLSLLSGAAALRADAAVSALLLLCAFVALFRAAAALGLLVNDIAAHSGRVDESSAEVENGAGADTVSQISKPLLADEEEMTASAVTSGAVAETTAPPKFAATPNCAERGNVGPQERSTSLAHAILDDSLSSLDTSDSESSSLQTALFADPWVGEKAPVDHAQAASDSHAVANPLDASPHVHDTQRVLFEPEFFQERRDERRKVAVDISDLFPSDSDEDVL